LDSTDFPIITPSSGDWSSWAEYRYRSDDVLGYVYYDLWNTGAANGGGFSYDEDDNINNDGGYQIRVSKTTGDWSDYPHTGTHPPTGVSTTNGNVALGTLFTFVKPSGTGQTPWMSDQNEAPSTATFNPPTSYTITGPPSNGYYPGYAINYDASSILPSGYPGTSGTKYYYGIGASGSIFSGGYYFYWDSSNNTWNDAAAGDGQADPVSFSYSATPVVNGTIITGIGGQGADFIFTMSGIVASSTPTQPTLVNTISITGGAWNNATYDNVNTDGNNTYYEYGLSIAGEQVKQNYYIAYNWTTRKWFDTQPTNHHNTFGTSSTDLNTTSRETTENPAVVYVFDTSPRFTAQFTNPYYEAIEPQTITPTSVNNSWTGATYIWKETVGTSEIYNLAFGGVATNNNHEIQVDTITNTWSDYGTNNPNTVTDNGSTVTLSSGTTTFVVFNKPTSASWL
jgi:hypothetical protein